MKTDELIDRLGRNVPAASPLPAPGIRTAVWMVWAVSYIVVVAAMMFAVMSSVAVTSDTALFLTAKCGAGHWDPGRACRLRVGDSGPEQPRVATAGGRSSGLGRIAVVGRRGRSPSVRDDGPDQSERLALRRLTDRGRSGCRGAAWLDVAAWRSADAWSYGLSRRVGRVELRQYSGVPDAPACIRADRPLVAWRHDCHGCSTVRPDRPPLVALA